MLSWSSHSVGPAACRVHYITQLLREGLHLEEPQVHIGRGNEGWTLGAALAENSKLRDREGAGQLQQGFKLCCKWRLRWLQLCCGEGG